MATLPDPTEAATLPVFLRYIAWDMIRIPYPALVLMAALCAAPRVLSADATPDSASTLIIRGGAFDTERSVPAFSEEHRESRRDGKHVATFSLFKAPDGKAMAQRSLDFSRFPLKPDYVFKDLRNGYEEGALAQGAAIRVYFRDSTRAPTKEKRIEVPEPCVVNGGMGFFIKGNWDLLAAGKRMPFNMVVPARLDFFRFVAYADPKKTLSDKESGGRKCVAFVIEPQSSLLRMLLPTIVMYYDKASKRMVRYQGISNVTDAKGRSLRVRVDYPNLGP